MIAAHATLGNSRFTPRLACSMFLPWSSPTALSLATTTARKRLAFSWLRIRLISSLSSVVCMALAVNHLPATMEFNLTMALGFTMAVTTAGATKILRNNSLRWLSGRRLRSGPGLARFLLCPALHGLARRLLAIATLDPRKLFSINDLGARRARKSLDINDLCK